MKQFMLKTVALFLCLGVVSFASCVEDDPTNNGGNGSGTSELSAAPTELTFAAAGETKTFEVKAVNVEWKATTDAKWLTLTGNEGSADGTVSVKAEANTEQEELKATIILSGEGVADVKIDVTQAAAEAPAPEVTASVKALSFTSGNYYSKVIEVESNMNWMADSDADWIRLDQQLDEGTFNGRVTVSVEKNTGAKRDGTISILVGEESVASITVSQKEAFTSELTGMYKPFIADPENPIGEFFITPTYSEGAEVPMVDVSFLFGPGAEWDVPTVAFMANQIVGMFYSLGLDHFEFRDDGTIAAGYRNMLGFSLDGGPTFTEEIFTYPDAETMKLVPADAITYYTENGKVYFCINKAYLTAIGQSELQTDLTEMIEGVILQYPEIGNTIVSNDEFFALPLNYRIEGAKVKLWIDREMMLPFIPLLSELAETMLPEEITVQMDPTDPETAMTIPVKNLLSQLLDGLFLKTKALEIGISLSKQ